MGDASLRRKRRAVLAALIAYLFGKHRGTYGSPRIAAERLRVRLRLCAVAPIRIAVRNTTTEIRVGDSREYALSSGDSAD